VRESQYLSWIDLLVDKAHCNPDKVLYRFLRGDQEPCSLTFLQLDQRARAIATHLQSLNLSGERALLIYPSGLDFIASFFGCLYAGVIAVPAYPPRRNQSMSRLESIIEDAQAAVVLTCTTLLESIQNRIVEHPQLQALYWLSTDTLSDDLAADWQKPDVTASTLAFLQYTSGSTGMPKGVMITHGNLLHNSAVIQQGFGSDSTLKGVIWLPPYHDMGLIGGVLQPLYAGGEVVLMSPMDFLQRPLRWLQAISCYRGTVSGAPNFAYDLCVQKTTQQQREGLDLSSWEVAFTGAEPIRAETLKQFNEAFECCGFRPEAYYPCYGMAETTLMMTGGQKSLPPVIYEVDSAALEQKQVVTADAAQEGSRKLVSCGQPSLGQKLVIVDTDSCCICTEDRVGEIWVSGASVSQGYWNQTKEKAKLFNAYADTGEGPFLRTGDLGFLHNKDLFITGRLKDVIIIRGQNHYPQDIEFTVQCSHLAFSPNGGAAFMVDIENVEKLIIVQEVERTYLRKLNVTDLVKVARQAIASQHGLELHSVLIVKPGSIPKTSSGKIRRFACRDEFLSQSLDIVEDWSENPMEMPKFR
jgi:acyl-CoA synthetase (AMP-forming)/AMP-acid ligase II